MLLIRFATIAILYIAPFEIFILACLKGSTEKYLWACNKLSVYTNCMPIIIKVVSNGEYSRITVQGQIIQYANQLYDSVYYWKVSA